MERYRSSCEMLAIALALMVDQDDTLMVASIDRALDIARRRLAGTGCPPDVIDGIIFGSGPAGLSRTSH